MLTGMNTKWASSMFAEALLIFRALELNKETEEPEYNGDGMLYFSLYGFCFSRERGRTRWLLHGYTVKFFINCQEFSIGGTISCRLTW